MTTDIRAVAAAAGVSVSTVSRTFTKPALVSPNTRRKVLDVSDRLGFRISRSAAALKSGQSMRIALLTSDGISTWFNSHVFAGLDTVLHPAGYDISVFTMTDPSERSRFFTGLPVQRNADAVVVNSFDIDPSEVTRLATMHVPIIGINVPSQDGFDATVGIDDRAAMHTAVDHLAALGHRHIAYVGSAGDEKLRYSADLRLQGFHEACAQHPTVEPQLLLYPRGDYRIDSIINAILTASPRLTAACFVMDELALPVLYRLHQYGREVPRDLSVIGFDDTDLAGQFGLTTLRQTPRELGVAAGHSTLASIEEQAGGERSDEQQASHLVFPTNLVLRNTTAPPATAPIV